MQNSTIGFNYNVLLHEIGHALGMAHPHDNGGVSTIFKGVTSAFGSVGDYGANKSPLTAMSYNMVESIYTPESNTILKGFMGTFGPIDTYVLQFLYGKNETVTGNNVYSLTANEYWETIFDTDGIDTIDASMSVENVVINLNHTSLINDTFDY